ncbi:DUF3516 domain-containing protein, partial [Auraticoccus sp. F435]
PKSVVREMYERAMTFGELVSEYGLSRSEGLVLRYLSDAWRTLRHTVPEHRRTPELEDLVEWLGEVIRQTDSSLLDEWEALVDPDPEVTVRPGQTSDAPRPITTNERAFGVLVRNAMWARLELAARDDAEGLAALERRVAELSDPPTEVERDAVSWGEDLDDYYDEHDSMRIDADARSPRNLQIERGDRVWRLRQVVLDPEGHHDWAIEARVDLAASDAAGAAVVVGTGLRRLDATP